MSLRTCIYVLIVTSLILVSKIASGQNLISGTIRSDSSLLIVNANIILYSLTTDEIISYTVSDTKGSFKMNYSTLEDSLKLSVTSLGYRKKEMIVKVRSIQTLNLQLKTEIIDLPTIVVKDVPMPITAHGDTIDYKTKAFTDKSDRVIIDVLKRLPGIKVTDNGQILFQDKAINKFYIDGKDLLESRYNIATNNLPTVAVETIQILKDHQPVKMLEGKEMSDRAAINIKLSKTAKSQIIGNGSLSAGLPLLQRNANLTLLKFNPHIQFINSIKHNNVGLYFDEEVVEHNLSTDQLESGSLRYDLLGLVRAERPNIARERYSVNNNSLANGNYLIGISKSLDFKAAFAYTNDYLKESSNVITRIFLPKDTIIIPESQQGNLQSNSLVGNITLQANDIKHYFKETLKFQKIWQNEANLISSRGIEQRLNNPFLDVTNELSGLANFHGQLIGYNSFVNYNDHPQQLRVQPGQFEDFLNDSIPYQMSVQSLILKNFYTNNSLTFILKAKGFTINNRIGFNAHIQRLNNSLEIVRNDIQSLAGDSFLNEITRNRLKLYDDLNASIHSKKIALNFGLQVSANFLKSAGKNLVQSAAPFAANPIINVKYKLNQFWDLTMTLSSSKSFYYEANPSFVLENYRSLTNSTTPLKVIKDKRISMQINYSNVLTGIFGGGTINYSNSLSNILIDNRYDGIFNTKIAIASNNPSKRLNASFNISQYLSEQKTNLGVTLKYDNVSYSQIQQGVLSDFNSYISTYILFVNARPSTSFTFEHKLSFTHLNTHELSSIASKYYDPIKFLKQETIIRYFMPKQVQIEIHGEHYLNQINDVNSKADLFVDGKIQKTIKSRIDVSLSVTNLFNIKSYVSYNYSNNYLVNSDYRLRGRLLMARIGFQF